MLGILLIDKPIGITSHDVVNVIRRKLGTKRVGHAGTLDPLATGLLVVAVGPATRFLQYLPLEPKEYQGTITFGKRTNTYDAEGEVISEGEVPADLAQQLENLKPRFMGLIEQIPPMHSAVKVAGKPLYKYARQGQEIDRITRTIHISELEFSPNGSDVDFRLVCSGGTYVRTLADDLGQAIGCGAYLTRLRRTRVGRFGLDPAVPLDQVAKEALIPLRTALAPMPVLELSDKQTAAIREGQMVTISAETPPLQPHWTAGEVREHSERGGGVQSKGGKESSHPTKQSREGADEGSGEGSSPATKQSREGADEGSGERSSPTTKESGGGADEGGGGGESASPLTRSGVGSSAATKESREGADEGSGERSSPATKEPGGGADEGGGGGGHASPEQDQRLNIVALADPMGQVFSVARLIGNLVQPECVIPSEALDGSI